MDELLAPDMFVLKKSRPTKESDCCALGMTIYEVLTEQMPLASFKSSVVTRKIATGERPGGPQGDNGRHFTGGVCVCVGGGGVIQRSWELQPHDRISVKAILMGLEGNPPLLELPSNASEYVEPEGDNQSDTTANDSGMFSLFHPRLIFDYPCDAIDTPTPYGVRPLVPPKTGDPEPDGLLVLRAIPRGSSRSSPKHSLTDDRPDDTWGCVPYQLFPHRAGVVSLMGIPSSYFP
jgi:hypothetical protein